MHIELTFDSSGVEKAIENLKRDLTEVETIGKILYHAASAIWIPRIQERLFQRTGASGYETDLAKTMEELDPDFVKRLGNQSGWANRTEAERRNYQRGEITSKISNAIKASLPIKGGGVIAVGIGDLNLLNEIMASDPKGEEGYKIWQILQWGTGQYVPGGSPVLRIGKQVFFYNEFQKGVLAYQTVNPGFAGREYFVQLDGTIHESDYISREYVLKYMRKIVKKYSYKKK